MKNKNKISFTLEQLRSKPCACLNEHLFNSTEIVGFKKSKYGNRKIEVDGIVFDSAKEARRYKELLLLLKAGEIGQLELQVPYELNAGGTHSYKYIADFVYIDARTGQKKIEDTKGHRTREYLKKRKLMKKVWGVEIFET